MIIDSYSLLFFIPREDANETLENVTRRRSRAALAGVEGSQGMIGTGGEGCPRGLSMWEIGFGRVIVGMNEDG